MRLTHDEFMRDLFGRNLPDAEFRKYMRPVADLMWKLCGEICRAGGNAVMDMGFWSKEDRRLAYAKASELAERVLFDVVECDMATAKRRVLARTENDTEALVVDEACFDKFVCRWFFIKAAREGPSAGALGKLRPNRGFYQSVDIRGKRLSGRAVDMPVKIKVV